MSNWHIEYICVKCKKVLSCDHRNYNDGVCPLCGFRDERAVTIAKTEWRTYRYIKTGPWWKFWQPKIKEYYNESKN